MRTSRMKKATATMLPSSSTASYSASRPLRMGSASSSAMSSSRCPHDMAIAPLERDLVRHVEVAGARFFPGFEVGVVDADRGQEVVAQQFRLERGAGPIQFGVVGAVGAAAADQRPEVVAAGFEGFEVGDG